MNRTNYDRYNDLLTPKIVALLFPKYGETDWEYRRSAINIYVFPQTWGSTSCGGGIGGAAVTTANTTVFLSNNRDRAAVFINDQFRYLVEHCSDEFFKDLSGMRMSGTKSAKYEKV